MDLKLAGKRALITGSSAGIGASTAMVLAREGAHVVVHGRDPGRAQAVVDSISAAGHQAKVALGDLSTDAGAASVVNAARAAFGGIDILINNAGGYGSRPWFETTPETWRQFFESDVLSAVRMIQAFVPAMKVAGWGRIVNVATGLATMPRPDLADYAAAKAAMVNSTTSLAMALAGSGIGACTLSPGLIMTDGVEKVLRATARERGWGDDWNVIQARWFADVLGSTAVKRLGTADEIANMIAYLASPLADYAVGANFRIDGGLVPSIN
jgi:3-oxoacyl-[acyl-carrier protein] reductase